MRVRPICEDIQYKLVFQWTEGIPKTTWLPAPASSLFQINNWLNSQIKWNLPVDWYWKQVIAQIPETILTSSSEESNSYSSGAVGVVDVADVPGTAVGVMGDSFVLAVFLSLNFFPERMIWILIQLEPEPCPLLTYPALGPGHHMINRLDWHWQYQSK